MALPAGESLPLPIQSIRSGRVTDFSNVQTHTQGYWDHEESGNMTPPKEYSKLPVTGHKEMETQKSTNKEFKIIVLKMLRKVEG